MNLEEYLEKDIISYLEKQDVDRKQKAERVVVEREQFSMSKDYMGLFNDAIQKKNFDRAKSLFIEVQNKFSSAKNEAEKEEYTGLIETMFAEMKTNGIDVSLQQPINKTEKKEETTDVETKETPDVLIPKPEEPPKEKLNEQKQQIKKEMKDFEKHLSELLQKHDIKEAINVYQTLKGLFNEFPDDDKEEKEELFNDVISAYYQIKKLEKIKLSKHLETKKEEQGKKQDILSRTKEDIQLITKRIEVAMEKQDIHEAMEQYETLKNTTENFPSEFEKEKKALYNHTLNIYNAIKKQSEEIKGKNIVSESSDTSNVVKEDTSLNFILNLKKELKETINLVKEKDLEKASTKLLNTKHSMNHFPEGRESEKTKFEHLINEINHRINFVRQTLNKDV